MTTQISTLCLLLITLFLSNSAHAFTYIFSKFPQKTVYEEFKAKYPDIEMTITADSEGKVDYGKFVDGGIHLIPVGPLDLYCGAIPGKKVLVIYHVNPDSPAEKAGLAKWDEIHGVNNTMFSKEHSNRDDIGVDGPIMELADAIDIGQAKGGILLNVVKRGKQGAVPLPLEKLGRFAPNAPHQCRKTHGLANEVAAYAVGEGFPALSRAGGTPLVLIGLLMHGDPELRNKIDEYMLRCIPGSAQAKYPEGGLYVSDALERSTWFHSFKLYALVEYYWATGDPKLVPIIQSMVYAVEQHQNPFGGSGHHIHGIGNYWDITFGPAGAVNIAAVALAEKAGFKVPRKVYEKYWNSMNNKATKEAYDLAFDWKFEIDPKRFYGVEYFARTWSGNKPYMGESALNTATAITALGQMPPIENSKQLLGKLLEHMSLVPYSHGYIHTTPSLGLFFSPLAISSFDQKGFQKCFQYRKYWLLLSRFPDKTRTYFPPKRARGGWGGDGYLSLHAGTYYQHLAWLNGHKRRLLSHNNPQRNWLSRENPRGTVNFLRQYHAFYANHLLTEAKKALSEKRMLDAYDAAQRIVDNYRETPAAKAGAKLLGMIKKKMGPKLPFLLTEREIEDYIHFIDVEHEDHSHYGDSVRPKLLNFVYEKFKPHPAAIKAKEMINKPFTQRVMRQKEKDSH